MHTHIDRKIYLLNLITLEYSIFRSNSPFSTVIVHCMYYGVSYLSSVAVFHCSRLLLQFNLRGL